LASFRYQAFQRPSGSTGCWMKNRHRDAARLQLGLGLRGFEGWRAWLNVWFVQPRPAIRGCTFSVHHSSRFSLRRPQCFSFDEITHTGGTPSFVPKPLILPLRVSATRRATSRDRTQNRMKSVLRTGVGKKKSKVTRTAVRRLHERKHDHAHNVSHFGLVSSRDDGRFRGLRLRLSCLI
jgi:hypothetical protein